MAGNFMGLSRYAIAVAATLCGWPMMAGAQAGSAPPVSIDSSAAFYSYNGLSLFDAGSSGGSPPAMLPRGVLKLPDDERYLFWVELKKGRLSVLQQQPGGGLMTRLVIPVSIGKNGSGKEREGDKRTPVGVYRITGYLDDEDLIDYYGLGAYPLNYPNAQDRRQRRTGSGIWLHGLPKSMQERPYLDSDGCVVIDNQSLRRLGGFINAGVTHVVLSEDDIHWRPASASRTRATSLEKAFQNWRRAWEAIDNAAYLAFYADDFSDFNRNKAEWAAYKTRVNNGKSFIEVGVTSLSFFTDPRRPGWVTVRYWQDYRSNNYTWSGWKEQLWEETGAGWRILYEGNG